MINRGVGHERCRYCNGCQQVLVSQTPTDGQWSLLLLLCTCCHLENYGVSSWCLLLLRGYPNATLSIPRPHPPRARVVPSLRWLCSGLLVSRVFQRLFWGNQSFRSKKLDDGETKCINVCAEKFIKLTSRVGLRFQDVQQQKARDEAAAAQR